MKTIKPIHELFEMQVNKNPAHTAFLFNQQAYSYQELNQKANQLARYLRRMHVKPNMAVSCCLERSFDYLVAILAILKAGAGYIPLDPYLPKERLLLILNESQSNVLITNKTLKNNFMTFQGQVIVLDEEQEIDEEASSNLEPQSENQDLAYVIFTSGSTGAPKGVLIEHHSVAHYSHWFHEFCEFQPQQRIDFSSNQAFDFAITTTLSPLMTGLTVVSCEDRIKKDPKLYVDYLNKHQIDFIKLTPSYFKVLLYEIENNPVEFPHLKKIMLAGETVPTADCARWLKMYPEHELYNEYGPTETCVGASLYKIDKNRLHELSDHVPIGHIAPYIQHYILDEDQKPVPEGEAGELYLGRHCLARGYLNNKGLTEEFFIKDPFSSNGKDRLYKTGDLSRQRPGGEIECLGRMDHQIKIRGFRVEPAEIEDCLTRHPHIKSAAVIASDKHHHEKRLIAYYIAKTKDDQLNDYELRQYLKQHLPDYMIPAIFVKMDSFPLNANEKLDRKALPVPQYAASQYYCEPSSDLEIKLADIWSKELGIHPIGIKDNFFELGGHSLSAAKITSEINHELNKVLSLHQFYRNPTIAELAPVVEQASRKTKQQPQSTPIDSRPLTTLPLSDFQFMLWLADLFEPKAKKLNVYTRKRFKGHLDSDRLSLALKAVLEKHEALSWHLSKFRPQQYKKDHHEIKITERTLTDCSKEEAEKILEDSLKALDHFYPWPKHQAQLQVRLFYLKGNQCELQLCMPHHISDDVSPEIVWQDLSDFYKEKTPTKNNVYQTHILEEQEYINKHLDRDVTFWENYLKDSQLFSFPKHQIITDMEARNHPYSSYIAMTEKQLEHFKRFCAQNRVTLLDGLSAAVLLALKNCCRKKLKKPLSLVINKIKSTRDYQSKHAVDEIIGCFLRTEPIKLTLKKDSSLLSLAQEAHEATIITHPHQQCPNMAKIAQISSFKQEKKSFKQHLIQSFVRLYTFLSRSSINNKIIDLTSRLNTLKGNDYLININVQNSLISKFKKQDQLFDLPAAKFINPPHDLLSIDNVLDISFVRRGHSNKPCLVLSANLSIKLREQMGKEIIKIMTSCSV